MGVGVRVAAHSYAAVLKEALGVDCDAVTADVLQEAGVKTTSWMFWRTTGATAKENITFLITFTTTLRGH